MELSSLPLMILLISNIHPGQTQERPKVVVKTEPDKHETVTVRCEIPGTEDDWSYSWFTDGSSRSFSSDREFSFKPDESHSSINITCRGERSDGQKSEISDAVTLNVSLTETHKPETHKLDTPKPVLTVQPEPSQIFRGETVTLTCNLQGEGWTYKWKCGDREHDFKENGGDDTQHDYKENGGDDKQHDSKENGGDDKQHDSKEKEFNITAEIRQKCRCSGCRRSGCSDWSDAVTLTMSDKPRVTVKPQSSVFTGDTVTLRCDVTLLTGQRIIWYKDFQRIKSGNETVTLRDVRVSDGGEYWCGVLRENNSTTQGHRVTLTVRERPKAVLRVQPDGRVFRGETVTLTCDIQETDVTSWTYSWNKDDSEIHVSQSQEYRISSVSESHTGNYSCSGRETRGSRHTHTSDEVTLTLSASGSRDLIIGVSAGLSVLFLLIFLLVLLWRCKHNKGGGSPSPSTEHQQQNIRTEEQKKSADSVNGPSDVTYAEIDLKPVKEMKKKKGNKGKTSESTDTVYSKLNIKTV